MTALVTAFVTRVVLPLVAPRDDAGRITVLVLGYFVVVATLLGVVGGIASVQTARHRLVAMADAAALEASQALDETAYYATGASAEGLPLSDESVTAAVEEALVATDAAADFPTLTVGALTGSPDGVSAQVQLTVVLDVPMVPATVDELVGGVPVTVVSRARSPLDPVG